MKEVEHASSDDAKADKLGELTKALIAYENQQSSKDASGKIKELQQAVDAKDAPMKKAIKDKNHTELQLCKILAYFRKYLFQFYYIKNEPIRLTDVIGFFQS